MFGTVIRLEVTSNFLPDEVFGTIALTTPPAWLNPIIPTLEGSVISKMEVLAGTPSISMYDLILPFGGML